MSFSLIDRLTKSKSDQKHHNQPLCTSKYTMAASKLSPQERLMRKRSAARLRQQRCRARKRQAMMERAAKTKTAPRTVDTVPQTPPPPTLKEAPKSPPRVSLPPRKLWLEKSRIGAFNPQSEYWSDDFSSSSTISLRPRTISFDYESPRSRAGSFDSLSTSSTFDSHTTEQDRQSPTHSVDAPSSVIFVPHLPNKEETAVDAMLALKTSSQKLCRPKPTVARPRPPVVYANCWNPMVYHSRPRLYLPHL